MLEKTKCTAFRGLTDETNGTWVSWMGTVFGGVGGGRQGDQRLINENSLGLVIWLFVTTLDNKWNINHGRVKPGS